MKSDTTDKKFFVAGGGTGGHIYPAISVINGLLKNGVNKKNIFYIGNKKNLEYKIALDMGLNFLSTPIFGMPRKISLKFIIFLFCLFISILKSFLYFLKYKPNVVFATGGYVCAPVLFAACLFKIPYVLHDSDCYPGMVTRIFSKNAFAVNLAFVEANKYIKSGNIRNFNNPVRNEFFKTSKEDARRELNIDKNDFLILIMGGSQGAKSINEAAIELIEKYKNKEGIKIILQTGRKNYDEVVKNFIVPHNVKIEPYFDNMAIPILAADLIVSRAGSISISEILSAKNVSVLIPYPYAAANHQRINARAVSDKNAAVYLEDNDLKKGVLIEAVTGLLADNKKYEELKENARILGAKFSEANDKILNLITSAIK